MQGALLVPGRCSILQYRCTGPWGSLAVDPTRMKSVEEQSWVKERCSMSLLWSKTHGKLIRKKAQLRMPLSKDEMSCSCCLPALALLAGCVHRGHV
jgi:hypothetical protein